MSKDSSGLQNKKQSLQLLPLLLTSPEKCGIWILQKLAILENLV